MANRAKNLSAIRAIKMVNSFTAPTPDEMEEVVAFIARAVAGGFAMPPVPSVNADRGTVGEFYTAVRFAAVHFGGTGTCPVVVLDAATVKSQADLRSFIALDPGMGDLVKAMVQAWRDDAGQWQAAREASARKQMTNDGETPETIAALLSSPDQLRQWIQRSRADLIITLQEAQYAVNASDPLNPATSKQRALLAHHASWFPDKIDDDEEYYPNDSAVDYFFLVAEIMVMLHRVGPCSADSLLARFAYFCRIAGAHLTNESISKGYAAMTACGAAVVEGVDIAGVVRAYPSDTARNGAALGSTNAKKHLPSQQRSPLRLLRVVAVGSMHQNAFQILNMEPNVQALNLVALSRLEATVRTAIASASNIAPGEDGLVLSHTMLWLVVAGRSNIFTPIYGRNDISVPTIAATVTAMAPDGLSRVRPRGWAFVLPFDDQLVRQQQWIAANMGGGLSAPPPIALPTVRPALGAIETLLARSAPVLEAVTPPAGPSSAAAPATASVGLSASEGAGEGAEEEEEAGDEDGEDGEGDEEGEEPEEEEAAHDLSE